MKPIGKIASLLLITVLAAGVTTAATAKSKSPKRHHTEVSGATSWPPCRNGWRYHRQHHCRVVPKAFPDITDVSHSSLRTANTITGFFEAKSRHVAADMVAFFAPEPVPVVYLEGGLGFAWESQQALLDVWSGDAFANGPPEALSYPLRIAGDDRSAIIEFVNTPELLGLALIYI